MKARLLFKAIYNKLFKKNKIVKTKYNNKINMMKVK